MPPPPRLILTRCLSPGDGQPRKQAREADRLSWETEATGTEAGAAPKGDKGDREGQLGPAASSLDTSAPTSQGAVSPPRPWPSAGADGRGWGAPVHHLPGEPSAPAHHLCCKLVCRNNFFPLSLDFPSKGPAPNSPQAAHGGLFRWPSVLRCRAGKLRLGLWGVGGRPSPSLTLARPRGRGRLRGEWQQGERAG